MQSEGETLDLLCTHFLDSGTAEEVASVFARYTT
jgi:hypothetical protein